MEAQDGPVLFRAGKGRRDRNGLLCEEDAVAEVPEESDNF